MTSGAALSFRRLGVVLAIPVVLIAAAVFLTANVERSAALLGGRQQESSLSMLNAIFDQEAAARGFFDTRDPLFLQRWNQGTSAFTSSVAELRSLVAGDAALRDSLADQAERADAWHAATGAAILVLERTGRSQSHDAIEDSRRQMDGFRKANAAFDVSLRKANAGRLTVATVEAVAVVAALAAMLFGIGLLVARRMARREASRHRDQAQLRELLQVSESEEESRMLLIRYLRKLLPAADAAVLGRSHDGDRLEVTTDGPSNALTLAASSERLRPLSCMAVRLGRSYDRSPEDDSLSRCEICGAIEGMSACEPLLVSGQTVGSVLVASRKAIPAGLRERVRETVSQAAPILVNQRNLMLAETLARSDSLTGLANRRAADETLERLVAQAVRSSAPAAVVLLDLDGLKQINDRHGHERGDSALALLGHIISAAIRASDFAARIGGDEFLIMLPDTGRDGAIVIAEKLLAEIGCAEIEGIGPISASLGVAVLPADATDGEELLRKADRALYAAKQQGRNCIGAFAPSTGQRRDQPARTRLGSRRDRTQPAGRGPDADHVDRTPLLVIATAPTDA